MRAARRIAMAGTFVGLFCGHALRAQPAAAGCDSICIARHFGAVAGADVGTVGWVLTGIVLPPVVVVGGAAAGAEFRDDKWPAGAAYVGSILGWSALRSRTRTVADPSPAVIANAGVISPAGRQAFIDAYKQRVRQKRRRSLHIGAAISVPVMIGFGAVVAMGLGGN
jgi:hypothetical protein